MRDARGSKEEETRSSFFPIFAPAWPATDWEYTTRAHTVPSGMAIFYIQARIGIHIGRPHRKPLQEVCDNSMERELDVVYQTVSHQNTSSGCHFCCQNKAAMLAIFSITLKSQKAYLYPPSLLSPSDFLKSPPPPPPHKQTNNREGWKDKTSIFWFHGGQS